MYPRLIIQGIRSSSRNVKRMFSTNLEKKVENMEKRIDRHMKTSVYLEKKVENMEKRIDRYMACFAAMSVLDAFTSICLSMAVTSNAIS